MHDSVATFYGGYDQVGLFRRAPARIPLRLVALGCAALALVSFVAADVSAYESRPALVGVTVVNWDVGNQLLTTSGGFTLHGSQSTALSLSCSSLCFLITGATVSPPFVLTGFTTTNHPIQYTNVTVQAPNSAYNGPMTITLQVAQK